MSPGFALEQRLSRSENQWVRKSPAGAVGNWDAPAGGRTFKKKMIFEPSALFLLFSLQEGKPPS